MDQMKIVYIAPNRLAYFVRKKPDNSGFEIVTQERDSAPRRCRLGGCDTDFVTEKDAQSALDLAIANKRDSGSNAYRWEVLVNGIPVPFEHQYQYRNGKLLLPSTVASFTEMTLGQIEFRIHEHVRGACENLLMVGRLLNEAKDGGLVPHGQWADWVRQHTGFHARTAQRLMQTARQVPAGSRMERLPISQVQAILALPDPEEQAVMAQRAEEENLTLRQLQEEIRKVKGQNDVLQEQAKDLLRERQEAEDRLRQKEKASDAAVMQEARQLAETLAQEKLGEALVDQGEKFGAEIDALREKLRQAEEEADAQAERAQAMCDKLLQLESAQGHEEKPQSSWTARRLNDCILRFLSEVSALPYMPDAASWPRAEREALIRDAFDRLGDFNARMRRLLISENMHADGEVR